MEKLHRETKEEEQKKKQQEEEEVLEEKKQEKEGSWSRRVSERNYIKMADRRALKKVRPKHLHLYHHPAKFCVFDGTSDVKFFLNPYSQS